MKSQYVNVLQEGDFINDYFVAARNDLRSKQDGGKFLGMVFKDRTGEIGGIMWNNAADVSRLFVVGDVVNVVNPARNRRAESTVRYVPASYSVMLLKESSVQRFYS